MPLFGFRDFVADTLGLSTEAERRTRRRPLVERVVRLDLPTVGNGRIDPGGGIETGRGEKPPANDD